MKKLWSAIEKNRFTVILPIIGAIIWFTAMGCEPTTPSPLTGRSVNVDQLMLEYESMIGKYDLAAKDIERKYKQQAAIKEIILLAASGGVTSMPALIGLILGGGGVGVMFDNRRKDTVIKAMKRGAQT